MKGPKVVIIGAGSLFFGRQAIWQMAHSEILQSGTLALVDTNPAHLAAMTALAEKVVEHTGISLKIESDIDRRKVLKDADFVVLSFAEKSVKYRGIDCEVSHRLGNINMCSGDTIGPGGIFRTLRELPVIIECTNDIRELCPNAWLINYINPTAAHGKGLRLYAPDLKSFALCDGLHMPHVKQTYAVRGGIIETPEDMTPEIERDFDFRMAGPNHFTWLIKAEYKGKDITPKIAESLSKDADTETAGGDTGAKILYNNQITLELYEAFGLIPVCVCHTKEYVRFWQGHGVKQSPASPLKIWETADRYERHWDMWNEVIRYTQGVDPISKFITEGIPDHATDIIETMWAGLDKTFYINIDNGNAVENMPSDAFLELPCSVNMDSVSPCTVGDAPIGLRGLWQQVLDSHELAAKAAIECDRSLLRAAFACDPLSVNLLDNNAIIEELLEREKDVLPQKWF